MKNVLKILTIVLMTNLSCSTDSDNQIELLEESKLNVEQTKITYEQRVFSVSDFQLLTKEEGSVFNKLSPETIAEFAKELKFGANGKPSTAIFTGIEKELSKKEQQIFWSYFGRNTIDDTDHKGYKCESPHNCKINSQYICMSGC